MSLDALEVGLAVGLEVLEAALEAIIGTTVEHKESLGFSMCFSSGVPSRLEMRSGGRGCGLGKKKKADSGETICLFSGERCQ
jgi:hypothetical protein